MAVYGYSRVSTEEQAGSGLGLAAQREAIDAEATRRGWTVEHVTDAGVSGSVVAAGRPGLGAVLERIRRDDVLVAAKLDRIGRSALDVLGLADRAEREGWSLIVLDLGLDTTTPVGRFTLTALAGVAQLERDLIGQRTREALAERKRAGARLGGPVVLSDEVRTRVVAEREAGRSFRAIADRLTVEGVPTARGGQRWYASTAQAVARSVALDAEAAEAAARAA